MLVKRTDESNRITALSAIFKLVNFTHFAHVRKLLKVLKAFFGHLWFAEVVSLHSSWNCYFRI